MALTPEEKKRLEYLDSLFKEKAEREMDEYLFFDSVEEEMEALKRYFRIFPGLTEEEASNLYTEWNLLQVFND